ncbi:MAG TPA: LuxR family transcriptional regulator [Dokdonella sp.]|jgi:DNA-binding CsgD family transcriptional regulator|nr:LuxR family transcriptional regulator [Dokdonella sp.]
MHDQLDSLQQLLECRSADELRLQSGRLLERLGFENWIYTSGSAAQGLPLWLNAYPADWMAHYRRQGYLEVDPVVEHCRHHTTPCLWAADPFARRAGYLTEFFSEAADYGLRAGIALPIHGPGGQSGMISVATDDTSHARSNLRHLGELHLLASFVHEAGQRLLSACAQEQIHLTARELDCLRWAAEGKTSWEIGQQLSIGERTVVFHLQNAARKLGVLGRRQAIAKAMGLQLIAV